MFKISEQAPIRGAATLAMGRGSQIVLGFVHIMAVNSTFGGTDLADIYYLAYGLFILITAVIVQSLTFTFVPVFVKWRDTRGEQKAWEFASTLFNLSLIVLPALSVAIWFLAPLIARTISPGFRDDPTKWEHLATLIRVLCPALLFTALGAIPRALYASYQSFVVPAVAALFVEIGLIAGTLIGGAAYGPRATLAGGVIGVALQACLLGTVFFAKSGLYRAVIRLGHEGLRRFGALLSIRIIAIGASQIGTIVDRSLATLAAGEGNVTALLNAFKISFLIPQLLIWGVCEAIVALFSRAWAAGDREKIKKILTRTVRLLLFLSVPAVAFLVAARTPLLAAAFERGEFDRADTARAALPLAYYALNLPFMMINFLLLAVLWAIEENWSVLKVSAVALVVNVAADFVFLHFLGYAGIALATLPRGVVVFCLAALLLNSKVAPLPMRVFIATALRLGVAGLCAYGAAWGLMELLGPAEGFGASIARVAICATAVAAVYIGVCAFLASSEVVSAFDQIKHLVARRGRPRQSSRDFSEEGQP